VAGVALVAPAFGGDLPDLVLRLKHGACRAVVEGRLQRQVLRRPACRPRTDDGHLLDQLVELRALVDLCRPHQDLVQIHATFFAIVC
jgi:hypothetical protein